MADFGPVVLSTDVYPADARKGGGKGWATHGYEALEAGKAFGKGRAFGKGSSKGYNSSPAGAKSRQPLGSLGVTTAQPEESEVHRAKDAVFEEIRSVLSANPALQFQHFDARVRQRLHGLHGSGGRQRVRDALSMIHSATMHKTRQDVKNWPAYLLTLLKKFDLPQGSLDSEERARQGVPFPVAAAPFFESPDKSLEPTTAPTSPSVLSPVALQSPDEPLTNPPSRAADFAATAAGVKKALDADYGPWKEWGESDASPSQEVSSGSLLHKLFGSPVEKAPSEDYMLPGLDARGLPESGLSGQPPAKAPPPQQAPPAADEQMRGPPPKQSPFGAHVRPAPPSAPPPAPPGPPGVSVAPCKASPGRIGGVQVAWDRPPTQAIPGLFLGTSAPVASSAPGTAAFWDPWVTPLHPPANRPAPPPVAAR